MTISKVYDGCFHCIYIERAVAPSEWSKDNKMASQRRFKKQNQLLGEMLSENHNFDDTLHDDFILKINEEGIGLKENGQAIHMPELTQNFPINLNPNWLEGQ